MKPAALELKNVDFSYVSEGTVLPILRDINLRIEPGEFVAVQGPSGSGKSTAMYILGGLLRPSKGQVFLEGREIDRLSDPELAIVRNKRLGFIFQQFHLMPKASVLENILLPTVYPIETAKPGAREKERATQLAQDLGLGERLDHNPNQLSGGQQQRVAIARALINGAEILLADEPTGNLDSKSSAMIIELLKELNRQGKTIVIVTHDPQIAAQCPRAVHFLDGRIVEDRRSPVESKPIEKAQDTPPPLVRWPKLGPLGFLRLAAVYLPLAVQNMRRNWTRSILTMLGVTIGVAALLALVTLGRFTQDKLLESYAELGVNTVAFRGYPNWNLKASDIVPVMFQSFNWERDVLPLKRIFPDLTRMTPTFTGRVDAASFGGKRLDQDVWLSGVNSEAAIITNQTLMAGSFINDFHVRNRSAVCVIGSEVAQRLFTTTPPIGQILSLQDGENTRGCRVIGVLESRTTNSNWRKPNLAIIVPYTYYQAVSGSYWSSRLFEILLQIRPGADIERNANSVKAFFEKKYGVSGMFMVDSDSLLIGQMKKFMTLFTFLLGAIALICLGVGGIGVANMMFVSISERYREIGLRKALGATELSIRVQFLLEAVILCVVAGVAGLIFGFIAYQTAIWAVSIFVPKLQFAWIFDPWAFLIALVSIVLVGVVSGLMPAFRAEKLQVVEALRAE